MRPRANARPLKVALRMPGRYPARIHCATMKAHSIWNPGLSRMMFSG